MAPNEAKRLAFAWGAGDMARVHRPVANTGSPLDEGVAPYARLVRDPAHEEDPLRVLQWLRSLLDGPARP